MLSADHYNNNNNNKIIIIMMRLNKPLHLDLEIHCAITGFIQWNMPYL